MVYSRGEPHCRKSTFVNGERVQEALPEYERRFAAHRRESSVVTCVLTCRDEGDEALTRMRATIVFTQGHHPRLDVVAWTVETFPKVGQEDDDDPGGRYLYADDPSEVHTLNDGWTHEWIDPATSATAVALHRCCQRARGTCQKTSNAPPWCPPTARTLQASPCHYASPPNTKMPNRPLSHS
jgi:hypothetical protein